jgi:hypothetical protein
VYIDMLLLIYSKQVTLQAKRRRVMSLCQNFTLMTCFQGLSKDVSGVLDLLETLDRCSLPLLPVDPSTGLYPRLACDTCRTAGELIAWAANIREPEHEIQENSRATDRALSGRISSFP